MEEVPVNHLLILLLFLFPSIFFFWLYGSLSSISRIKLSGILWERSIPAEYSKFLENSAPAYSFLGNLFFLFFIGYFSYSFRFNLYGELLLIAALFVIFYVILPKFLCKSFRLQGISMVLLLIPIMKLFLKEEREEEEEEEEVSDGEVEAFIEEGKEENIIDEEEEEMLRNVIEFSDTIVKEIMTPHSEMVVVPYNMSIREVARIIEREKKSRLPVYRDVVDHIEGVIYAKDIAGYCFGNIEKQAKELLRDAIFVPENLRISEAMKIMKDKKTKIAIAVDEYGGVSGLITMEDIVEEIVGEIREVDEEEEEKNETLSKKGKVIRVSGDYDIEKLEDELGIEFPDGDYSTLAGFVMFHLGRIAHRGEEFSYGGFRFKIIDADKRSIKKLRIVKEEN